jgi:sulfatase modifying factor 1
MFKRSLALFAVVFVACGGGSQPNDSCLGGDCGEHDAVDPCSGVDCGDFGTCVVSDSNEASCKCDDGYYWDGSSCIDYFDPCSGVDCGEHGTCVVGDSNEASCKCDDGYRWDDSSCVATVDPCSGVDCGEHGACVVGDSNEASCKCDDGYSWDGSSCVATVDPCSGVDCGEHGTCVVSDSNEASCECDDGYHFEGSECVMIDPLFNNCAGGWCLIPAGSFDMGSPDTEPCREAHEGPVHSVTITSPFYMKQTHVTQAEWRAKMDNDPSTFTGCDDCPVEKVNWFEAVSYANALSTSKGYDTCYEMTGCEGKAGEGLSKCTVTFKGLDCEGYRLPTEAEWEYAARAGTTTAYWIGSNIGDGGEGVCGGGDPLGTLLPDAGWYWFNSENRPHPVAQLQANSWGLYDVHGNVYEWVNDYYDSNYYGECSEGCNDPLGPDPGTGRRVYRGGCYIGDAKFQRSAYRNYSLPNYSIGCIGFRLVRTVP